MTAPIKALFRPLYRLATRNPFFQAVLRREMGALGTNPWTAQVIREFVDGDAGSAYGLSPGKKRGLVEQFKRNTACIESGTPFIAHVVLANAVLAVPPEIEGDLVECGVWKGASSASLSLVAQLTGRRLKVCDSFAGLPDEGGTRHTGMHTGVYGHYKEGMFKGTMEEVCENIGKYGAFDACDFVAGFFDASLGALADPVVFAFLDVDLESSTRDCLRVLWPRLVENGFIYCDDAGDLEVVKAYFDDPWWQENLGCPAPGLVGSGCGLPLAATYSSLGYTRKQTRFDAAQWRKAPFLDYPEDAP